MTNKRHRKIEGWLTYEHVNYHIQTQRSPSRTVWAWRRSRASDQRSAPAVPTERLHTNVGTAPGEGIPTPVGKQQTQKLLLTAQL